MRWPWLDVVFWAEQVEATAEDDAVTHALIQSAAIFDPKRLVDDIERRARAADKRTPEEIFASVAAASARGWK